MLREISWSFVAKLNYSLFLLMQNIKEITMARLQTMTFSRTAPRLRKHIPRQILATCSPQDPERPHSEYSSLPYPPTTLPLSVAAKTKGIRTWYPTPTLPAQSRVWPDLCTRSREKCSAEDPVRLSPCRVTVVTAGRYHIRIRRWTRLRSGKADRPHSESTPPDKWGDPPHAGIGLVNFLLFETLC